MQQFKLKNKKVTITNIKRAKEKKEKELVMLPSPFLVCDNNEMHYEICADEHYIYIYKEKFFDDMYSHITKFKLAVIENQCQHFTFDDLHISYSTENDILVIRVEE